MTELQRTCVACGVTFVARQGGRPQRFCSDWCRRHEFTHQCEHCGEVFATSKKSARFCGNSCRGKWLSEQMVVLQSVCLHCGTCFIYERPRFGANRVVCSKVCENARRADALRGAGHRRKSLKKLYGLTPEQFDAMVLAQDGRCKICHTDEPGGRHGVWHVDHDHATGAVRCLLCANCNLMIGHARENPAILRAGAAYLVEHRQLRLIA